MISKTNYKKYVTDRPLKKGDLIAHDGCEPYYVFDGKGFLQIYRDGNRDGKLKINNDFYNNLDYPEVGFYRFSYMGNIADDVRITDWLKRDEAHGGWLKVEKELIPDTLKELMA